jgi:hypothetical protein
VTRYATVAFFVLLATSASATMPTLTPTPDPATPDACKAWAASQDEDAIEMWGIQESGDSSPEIAVQRLALFCQGDQPPEIVGFGSSVGFDDAYCQNHPKQKICADR